MCARPTANNGSKISPASAAFARLNPFATSAAVTASVTPVNAPLTAITRFAMIFGQGRPFASTNLTANAFFQPRHSGGRQAGRRDQASHRHAGRAVESFLAGFHFPLKERRRETRHRPSHGKPVWKFAGYRFPREKNFASGKTRSQ